MTSRFIPACLSLLIFSLSACSTQVDSSATITSYVTVQEALAADDFAAAKAALDALAGVSSGETKMLAEQAAKAKDIAAMREAFRPLSEAVVKMNLPPGYTGAFCPMGAGPWVQREGKIRNPYYGASMLECGEVTKKGGYGS